MNFLKGSINLFRFTEEMYSNSPSPHELSTPEISSINKITISLEFNYNLIPSPFIYMVSWVHIVDNAVV
jgi:hypothetical protein